MPQPEWTEPRTWVDGETMIASALNTHLRDQMDVLHSSDHVMAYRTTSVALTTDEWETLHWDADRLDNNQMHHVKRRNSRFHVHRDGTWLMILKLDFSVNTTGLRWGMIRRNSEESESGGNTLGQWVSAGITPGETVVWGMITAPLRRGDYLNVFGKQSSGANLNLVGDKNNSWFQMVQLTDVF